MAKQRSDLITKLNQIHINQYHRNQSHYNKTIIMLVNEKTVFPIQFIDRVAAIPPTLINDIESVGIIAINKKKLILLKLSSTCAEMATICSVLLDGLCLFQSHSAVFKRLQIVSLPTSTKQNSL